MKPFFFPAVLLAFVLSACVETVELSPVYEQDNFPAFSDGSIPIRGTDPSSVHGLINTNALSLNLQAQNRIHAAVNGVTYKLTPEAAAEVFERFSTDSFDPGIDLSQEQKDDLLLNNLSKYRKYARINNQKQELALALDEIAAACGKEKNDPVLFSSADYFRTYVSFMAVCLEMERFVKEE